MRINDYIIGNNQIKKLYDFKIGSALLIRYEFSGGHWKSRKFIGILIAKSGTGSSTRYTLRNIIGQTAVEFSFYIYSPAVISLEKLPILKFKSVRRAKFFFLRKKPLNQSFVKV